MITKEKKVHYCEFCKKHGLSVHYMRQHERHCTLNPKRECRVCKRNESYEKEIKIVEGYYDVLMSMRGKDGVSDEGILGTHCETYKQKIKKLAEELNCPACMLSIIRQSKIGFSWFEYNFKEKMQEHFARKNEEAEREEYFDLMARDI